MDHYAYDLALEAVKALDGKKAADIRMLELRGLSNLADYFVICSGQSDTQVKALADAVDQALGAKGITPRNTEGYRNANWILLDYGDVIVHIFYKETREFYKLEHLWSDAPAVDLSKLLDERAD